MLNLNCVLLRSLTSVLGMDYSNNDGIFLYYLLTSLLQVPYLHCSQQAASSLWILQAKLTLMVPLLDVQLLPVLPFATPLTFLQTHKLIDLAKPQLLLLKHGIKKWTILVIHQHIQNLYIQEDNQLVIRVLQDHYTCPWTIQTLIDDIEQLLRQFIFYTIKDIFREANRIADLL